MCEIRHVNARCLLILAEQVGR